MEDNDLHRVRSEDGRSDEPGGSPPDTAPDRAEESNVISIADFTDSGEASTEGADIDIDVISRELEVGYINERIKEELYKIQSSKPTLTPQENWSWVAFGRDPFFSACSPRVRLAALQYPPFYLYKLKSTGHFGVIMSYEEAKPKYRDRYTEGKITVSIALMKEWNHDLLTEKMLRFCPLTDLERLQHRAIAKRDRVISRGAV